MVSVSKARARLDLEQRRLDHANDLLRMFPDAEDAALEGAARTRINKRLRRLERKAHLICIDYCNGVRQMTEDGEYPELNAIEVQVDKILGNADKRVPTEINLDPRGYALKIDAAWMREHYSATGTPLWQDLGGYGILSPRIEGWEQ